MSAEILYYNDRKGRQQSHNVFINTIFIDTGDGYDTYNIADGLSYDLLDAMKKFYSNAKTLQKELNQFISDIESGDIVLKSKPDGDIAVTHEIIDNYYTGEVQSKTPVEAIIKQFLQEIKEDKKDE